MTPSAGNVIISGTVEATVLKMNLEALVRDELSGSKAKSYVVGLTGHHRIQASPMMHAAAEDVRDRLLEIGVDEVEIIRLLADGRKRYWTHISTLGWNVNEAELSMVEPDRRVLVRFSDIPQSLHTLSRSTPEGGVTGDLVDVGKGTSENDYSGKRVKGRFVLATGRAKPVHREAVVKRGALGVLTDALVYEFPGVRETSDIPDAHAYQGLWPDAEEAKKLKFGFSVSRRQGNELRRLLSSGVKVRLHATVDAEIVPGEYSIVTAAIKGESRPEEEIFLSAHLCHPKPGANDNASGSGLLLEIARTIAGLVGSGKMPRPSRTIRFLWVPETTGTVAYLSENPEAGARLVAGINLDMVGSDQQRCRSTLCMDPTPDSIPSFLNDLVFSTLMRSDAYYDDMVKIGLPSNFRRAWTKYSGGSDHSEFNDSTIGVPCVGLTQWPDLFYHTSLDTVQNLSEDSLRRVGWTAAVSVLTMAHSDGDSVHELAHLTCSGGKRRISEAAGEASRAVFDARHDLTPSSLRSLVESQRDRVMHVVKREQRAVLSVARLDDRAGADGVVVMEAESLAEHGRAEMKRLDGIVGSLLSGRGIHSERKPSKAERRLQEIVPKRLFKGTLDDAYVVKKLGIDRSGWYDEAEERDSSFSRKTYEMANLMDGKTDMLEIVRFVSAEYGPTDPADVFRFLDDMREMQLISF